MYKDTEEWSGEEGVVRDKAGQAGNVVIPKILNPQVGKGSVGIENSTAGVQSKRLRIFLDSRYILLGFLNICECNS